MDCLNENTELNNKILLKINEEFGNDLSKINDCEKIIKEVEERKQIIENSFKLESSNVPTKISSAIKHVQEMLEKTKQLSKQHDNLNNSLDNYVEKVETIRIYIESFVIALNNLGIAKDYFIVIKEIEELSDSLKLAFDDKNERKQVSNFIMLSDIFKSLAGTKCLHLLSYANQTVHYWHNILKEKFTSDFEDILKLLKWPFVGESVVGIPAPDVIHKFQTLAEYLIQIQLDKEESTTLPTDPEPISLLMSQLIKPLKKRFIYHFMGKRQTNRVDKPEWYFTQILTWARDHLDFIEKNVQPVYNKFEHKCTPAKIEFIKGLVQITIEKLHYELPHLYYDDSLFSHCVDEALGFDKELKKCFGYPTSEPGVIEVLTQAQIFVKWINVEKQFTLEKMDVLLTSTTAFNRIMTTDVDEYHVTECGNSFLTLLSTITERYETLPQPGHRLQFLQLQLDLIDDFRVRLLQKLREENSDPLSSNYPNILNTVNYVKEVLTEWSVNTFFLHLQYYKMKAEGKNETNGTVFDDYLAILEKMRDDLLAELIDFVFMEVKAKSMPYRKDKWHAMDSIKNFIKPTITPTACPMFQVLITKLHQLKEVLATSLFQESWKILANKIDQYLYEEIVSICAFNEDGALQFNYDITKNLFPLFGQYSNKPETNFKLLKDSCVILSMPKGLALSLKQAITEKQEDGYDASEVLADLSIFTLLKDDVMSLLSRMIHLE